MEGLLRSKRCILPTVGHARMLRAQNVATVRVPSLRATQFFSRRTPEADAPHEWTGAVAFGQAVVRT